MRFAADSNVNDQKEQQFLILADEKTVATTPYADNSWYVKWTQKGKNRATRTFGLKLVRNATGYTATLNYMPKLESGRNPTVSSPYRYGEDAIEDVMSTYIDDENEDLRLNTKAIDRTQIKSDLDVVRSVLSKYDVPSKSIVDIGNKIVNHPTGLIPLDRMRDIIKAFTGYPIKTTILDQMTNDLMDALGEFRWGKKAISQDEQDRRDAAELDRYYGDVKINLDGYSAAVKNDPDCNCWIHDWMMKAPDQYDPYTDPAKRKLGTRDFTLIVSEEPRRHSYAGQSWEATLRFTPSVGENDSNRDEFKATLHSSPQEAADSALRYYTRAMDRWKQSPKSKLNWFLEK